MKRFENMRQFYNYMEQISREGRIFETETLKEISSLVESDAKRKFGERQNSVGPFAAWPEALAESTQKERVRQGYSPNDPLYRSGDLMNSIYTKIDINGKMALVGSDDPVLLWQELGTARIPARPTLGPALFQNKNKIQKIASKMFFSWVTNKPFKTGIR